MSRPHQGRNTSSVPSDPSDVVSSSSTLLASGSASPQTTQRGSAEDANDQFEPRHGQKHAFNESDSSDGEDVRLLSPDAPAAPKSSAGLDALPTDEDERPSNAQHSAEPDAPKEKAGPVSWSSLPRKDQLAILTLARLSEPLTQTSLQSYMFYQLRSFSPSAPDSTISYQAGLLQAAFTGAQFCTAVLWGRVADSKGRKKVILVGLLGTAIGAVGFGFSGSFAVALLWRALGGGE